jgi:hypothetical protein
MTEPDPSALAAEDVAGLDGDDPSDLDDVLGSEDPEPAYLAIEDWVSGYFLPMFRRTLGGEFRWCHQWWQHGEAISRLTALWHSWEVLRLQPGTGIATWYRDYLDQQLPILMGARGPLLSVQRNQPPRTPPSRRRARPRRLVGPRSRRPRQRPAARPARPPTRNRSDR